MTCQCRRPTERKLEVTVKFKIVNNLHTDNTAYISLTLQRLYIQINECTARIKMNIKQNKNR